jgi:hypothetical protein
VFTHIYFSSPDRKYENDDDGTGLLSFFCFDAAKIKELFETSEESAFFFGM